MQRSKKALQYAIAVAAATFLTAGCADKWTASKDNFAHILNDDYKIQADCLFTKPLPFPYELPVNDKLMSETRRRLDALVNAGLLSREQASAGRNPVARYSLTATGSQVQGNGRFCYGRREVTSIEKFSTPVDYDGQPLTRIQYHFVIKDAAPWAKAPDVRNAFPVVDKALSEQPVDEATLILTKEGWEMTY